MQRRILLLGTTGLEKRFIFSQLQAQREEELRRAAADIPDLYFLDFEDELTRVTRQELHTYLDAAARFQEADWERTWDHIDALIKDETRDTFLALHGVLARPIYGVRSIADINLLQSFQPTHIFTFIDDVYVQWSRTEARAGGRTWKGRPTLADLIDARRKEVFFGDLLARHTKSTLHGNTLLSVRHPARVLSRLTYTPDPRTVYLSFPISEPRRLQAKGDTTGIEEVTSFLRRAADIETEVPHLVFFSPLTIDELPLLKQARLASRSETDMEVPEEQEVTFRPSQSRWNLRDIWPDDRLLARDQPDRITIPRGHIHHAAGLIEEDVKVRDYRLVLQSSRLLVFNPLFDGVMKRGVRNEIASAILNDTPVYILQQDHRGDIADLNRLLMGDAGPAGSMGIPPTERYYRIYSDMEEMFQDLISD